MADNCVTVIDIGSGSMKASVFANTEDGITPVASVSRGFRLCKKIGCNISKRKINVTSEFIQKVVKMTKDNHSSQIIAVATQAARRASNFSDLQNKILEEHGVKIHMLSGAEEAKLTALSVKYFTNFHKFVSIDIGCGSVDIAEFNERVKGAWSLPVSSLDLSKSVDYGVAEKSISRALEKLKFKCSDASLFPLVGNGGTLRVSSMLINHKTNGLLNYEDLKQLFNEIKDKTEEERIEFGVPKARSDILPFGLLIILKLMEHLHIEELILVDGSLRMSLALKFFNKLEG